MALPRRPPSVSGILATQAHQWAMAYAALPLVRGCHRHHGRHRYPVQASFPLQSLGLPVSGTDDFCCAMVGGGGRDPPRCPPRPASSRPPGRAGPQRPRLGLLLHARWLRADQQPNSHVVRGASTITATTADAGNSGGPLLNASSATLKHSARQSASRPMRPTSAAMPAGTCGMCQAGTSRTIRPTQAQPGCRSAPETIPAQRKKGQAARGTPGRVALRIGATPAGLSSRSGEMPEDPTEARRGRSPGGPPGSRARGATCQARRRCRWPCPRPGLVAPSRVTD